MKRNPLFLSRARIYCSGNTPSHSWEAVPYTRLLVCPGLKWEHFSAFRSKMWRIIHVFILIVKQIADKRLIRYTLHSQSISTTQYQCSLMLETRGILSYTLHRQSISTTWYQCYLMLDKRLLRYTLHRLSISTTWYQCSLMLDKRLLRYTLHRQSISTTWYQCSLMLDTRGI